MNSLPERSLSRQAALIGQIYTAGPGDFPELTYRRIKQEAEALCAAGGQDALTGHVILGVLAPIRFDRQAFEAHFAEARRLAPDHSETWCNEALFSVYFGLGNRVADIVTERRLQIFAAVDIANLLYDVCSWCCMVNTAMELRDFLLSAGRDLADPELPMAGLSKLLKARGLPERALVERMSVAAEAAVATIGGPLRGYHVIGNEATGYAYEMLFDTDSGRVIAAGVAVAEAVTQAFEDDLSDVMTFSAARYIGAVHDGG